MDGTLVPGDTSVSLIVDGPEARLAVDDLVRRAWEVRLSDPHEAIRLAERARLLAEAAGYPRGLGYALRARGTPRSALMEHDAALADLQAAVRIFEEIGDSAGKASALSRIGIVHQRRADFASALAPLLEALRIQREVGDQQGESDTLNFLGNLYYEFDDFSRALEYYRDSRRIKEALGDIRGLSDLLNNIGNIHGRLGDYTEALEHHRRALALKRELGERHVETGLLINIGTSYMLPGDHEPALEYYQAALDLARRHGDRRNEGDALCCMGEVFRKKGDPRVALVYLEQSLEVVRSIELPHMETEVLFRLGHTLVGAGEDERALETLRLALELAEQTSAHYWICEANRVLSELHERRGDAVAALRHFKRCREVEAEVFSSASERRIQAILAQAEVERTEREAELLRTKNGELSAANQALRDAEEQLRRQAEELDRLAREDALTGLANRRELDARLALEWERARRFGRPLTVALADLDHFKEVNDRFSHATGDAVLREVARIFREVTRQIDVVGRYGGEELMLLLVETPPESAAAACEKLRAAVEAHDWASVDPALRVTVSIGLSGDLSAHSPQALLADADRRLYEAKRGGRNRVCG